MLKQSIEQYTEEFHDGPVAAPAGGHEPYQVRSAVIDKMERELTDKVLSDIARNFTSARGRESRLGDFMSHLGRILGGGLRTSW